MGRIRRAAPYIHEIFEVRMFEVERRDTSGEQCARTRRKVGKRLAVVRGRRAFRRWVIAHYKRHGALWHKGQAVGFRLLGSQNRRRYHIVLLRESGRGVDFVVGIMGEGVHGAKFGPLCYSHSTEPCRRVHRGGAICAASVIHLRPRRRLKFR